MTIRLATNEGWPWHVSRSVAAFIWPTYRGRREKQSPNALLRPAKRQKIGQ
jgi:hypothetical protein